MTVRFVLNGEPTRSTTATPTSRCCSGCARRAAPAPRKAAPRASAARAPSPWSRRRARPAHVSSGQQLPGAAARRRRARPWSPSRASPRATARCTRSSSAMVEAGGSQCGYCTPGFVVSLFCEYYRPDRARRLRSRVDQRQPLPLHRLPADRRRRRARCRRRPPRLAARSRRRAPAPGRPVDHAGRRRFVAPDVAGRALARAAPTPGARCSSRAAPTDGATSISSIERSRAGLARGAARAAALHGRPDGDRDRRRPDACRSSRSGSAREQPRLALLSSSSGRCSRRGRSATARRSAATSPPRRRSATCRRRCSRSTPTADAGERRAGERRLALARLLHRLPQDGARARRDHRQRAPAAPAARGAAVLQGQQARARRHLDGRGRVRARSRPTDGAVERLRARLRRRRRDAAARAADRGAGVGQPWNAATALRPRRGALAAPGHARSTTTAAAPPIAAR